MDTVSPIQNRSASLFRSTVWFYMALLTDSLSQHSPLTLKAWHDLNHLHPIRAHPAITLLYMIGPLICWPHRLINQGNRAILPFSHDQSELDFPNYLLSILCRNHMQAARRHTCFQSKRYKCQGAKWGLTGRFDNHRTPSCQRRSYLSSDHCGGKIPWCNDAANANQLFVS